MADGQQGCDQGQREGEQAGSGGDLGIHGCNLLNCVGVGDVMRALRQGFKLKTRHEFDLII